jgi:hypothetical protein
MTLLCPVRTPRKREIREGSWSLTVVCCEALIRMMHNMPISGPAPAE